MPDYHPGRSGLDTDRKHVVQIVNAPEPNLVGRVSKRDTRYRYGIKQEFIRPHKPQQNGMVERLIRSEKEQCLWLNNFESLEEARQVLRA